MPAVIGSNKENNAKLARKGTGAGRPPGALNKRTTGEIMADAYQNFHNESMKERILTDLKNRFDNNDLTPVERKALWDMTFDKPVQKTEMDINRVDQVVLHEVELQFDADGNLIEPFEDYIEETDDE